jgi:hypothetical protein
LPFFVCVYFVFTYGNQRLLPIFTTNLNQNHDVQSKEQKYILLLSQYKSRVVYNYCLFLLAVRRYPS